MKTNQILAIDPGSISSGYAIITLEYCPQLLCYGTVKKKEMYTHLIVSNIKATFEPIFAVIEDQFLGQNANSFKILARNTGHWESACWHYNIDVDFIYPTEWQRSVLGKNFSHNRKQIKAASKFVAKSDTGLNLGQDESDAYCLGKYKVIDYLNKQGAI